MSGPASAVASVLACGLPMVLWSVFVDKEHRNPSTGIDWSRRRPWRETLDISFTKPAGLWATWALIAFAYFVMRYYWQGPYSFAMSLLAHADACLLLAAVPFTLWPHRPRID